MTGSKAWYAMLCILWGVQDTPAPRLFLVALTGTPCCWATSRGGLIRFEGDQKLHRMLLSIRVRDLLTMSPGAAFIHSFTLLDV